MNRTARCSVLLAVFMALGACGSSKGQEIIPDFAGEPYMGDVDVRVLGPGKSEKEVTEVKDSGRGSAQFIDQGNGSARLIVIGNIKGEADAGFVVDGLYVKNGWSSQEDGVQLTVAPDGVISGGGMDAPHKLRFNGSVSEDRFILEVVLELMEAGKNGVPAGTRFLFEYELHRNVAVGTKGSKSETDDGSCKRVEWRLKNVPNFSGGPMGLVRVPYCVN